MNIQQAIDRFKRLERLEGVLPALDEGMKELVRDAAIEPPERPGQKYTRTHTLSGSWELTPARRTAREVVAAATNKTPYAPYVQGNTRQVDIHKGRWRVAKKIGQDNMAQLRARVLQALLRIR